MSKNDVSYLFAAAVTEHQRLDHLYRKEV
jgi:hypothetical protein